MRKSITENMNFWVGGGEILPFGGKRGIINSIFVLGGHKNLEENQLGSIGSIGAHLFGGCRFYK